MPSDSVTLQPVLTTPSRLFLKVLKISVYRNWLNDTGLDFTPIVSG